MRSHSELVTILLKPLETELSSARSPEARAAAVCVWLAHLHIGNESSSTPVYQAPPVVNLPSVMATLPPSLQATLARSFPAHSTLHPTLQGSRPAALTDASPAAGAGAAPARRRSAPSAPTAGAGAGPTSGDTDGAGAWGSRTPSTALAVATSLPPIQVDQLLALDSTSGLPSDSDALKPVLTASDNPVILSKEEWKALHSAKTNNAAVQIALGALRLNLGSTADGNDCWDIFINRFALCAFSFSGLLSFLAVELTHNQSSKSYWPLALPYLWAIANIGDTVAALEEQRHLLTAVSDQQGVARSEPVEVSILAKLIHIADTPGHSMHVASLHREWTSSEHFVRHTAEVASWVPGRSSPESYELFNLGDVPSGEGQPSILLYAAQKQHWGMVTSLLSLRQRLKSSTSNERYYSPFGSLKMLGKSSWTSQAFAETDAKGKNLLHHVAASKDPLARICLVQILKNSTNRDYLQSALGQRDNTGKYPLHYAAEDDSCYDVFGICQTKLSKGLLCSALSQADAQNRTVLHYLAEHQQGGMILVELCENERKLGTSFSLNSAFSTKDNTYFSPLMIAAVNGHPHAVRAILSRQFCVHADSRPGLMDRQDYSARDALEKVIISPKKSPGIAWCIQLLREWIAKTPTIEQQDRDEREEAAKAAQAQTLQGKVGGMWNSATDRLKAALNPDQLEEEKKAAAQRKAAEKAAQKKADQLSRVQSTGAFYPITSHMTDAEHVKTQQQAQEQKRGGLECALSMTEAASDAYSRYSHPPQILAATRAGNIGAVVSLLPSASHPGQLLPEYAFPTPASDTSALSAMVTQGASGLGMSSHIEMAQSMYMRHARSIGHVVGIAARVTELSKRNHLITSALAAKDAVVRTAGAFSKAAEDKGSAATAAIDTAARLLGSYTSNDRVALPALAIRLGYSKTDPSEQAAYFGIADAMMQRLTEIATYPVTRHVPGEPETTNVLDLGAFAQALGSSRNDDDAKAIFAYFQHILEAGQVEIINVLVASKLLPLPALLFDGEDCPSLAFSKLIQSAQSQDKEQQTKLLKLLRVITVFPRGEPADSNFYTMKKEHLRWLWFLEGTLSVLWETREHRSFEGNKYSHGIEAFSSIHIDASADVTTTTAQLAEITQAKTNFQTLLGEVANKKASGEKERVTIEWIVRRICEMHPELAPAAIREQIKAQAAARTRVVEVVDILPQLADASATTRRPSPAPAAPAVVTASTVPMRAARVPKPKPGPTTKPATKPPTFAAKPGPAAAASEPPTATTTTADAKPKSRMDPRVRRDEENGVAAAPSPSPAAVVVVASSSVPNPSPVPSKPKAAKPEAGSKPRATRTTSTAKPVTKPVSVITATTTPKQPAAAPAPAAPKPATTSGPAPAVATASVAPSANPAAKPASPAASGLSTATATAAGAKPGSGMDPHFRRDEGRGGVAPSATPNSTPASAPPAAASAPRPPTSPAASGQPAPATPKKRVHWIDDEDTVGSPIRSTKTLGEIDGLLKKHQKESKDSVPERPTAAPAPVADSAPAITPVVVEPPTTTAAAAVTEPRSGMGPRIREDEGGGETAATPDTPRTKPTTPVSKPVSTFKKARPFLLTGVCVGGLEAGASVMTLSATAHIAAWSGIGGLALMVFIGIAMYQRRHSAANHNGKGVLLRPGSQPYKASLKSTEIQQRPGAVARQIASGPNARRAPGSGVTVR